MAGLPVTISAAHPPLHEFLPSKRRDQRPAARAHPCVARVEPRCSERVACRSGLCIPEIYKQIRAIARAARAVQERDG